MKKSKKKEKGFKIRVTSSMEMINPNTAGIDIGGNEHWVCVPEDRADKNVRRFGAFTKDLYAIADWLKACKITSIAMESTGIYWIPLFQILEKKKFKVCLVNARHLKSVAGRTKTDRYDCQWIQKLHSYGLLSPSFRPNDETCKLRSLIRHRDNLISMASKHTQHMQKALHQMNILLSNVVSDITGDTGMKIIKGIAQGEERPEVLAENRDPRIKATKEEIIEALRGDYRKEHIFVLKQSLELYNFVHKQISKCDSEVENLLEKMNKKVDRKLCPLPGAVKRRKKPRKNEPSYDLQTYLYEITGVDLTRVPGFETTGLQKIVSEVGVDMVKWKTDKHYTSWLGLAPNKEISGGKILKEKTKKVQSPAARHFRMAAFSLKHSQSYLGSFYRKIRARSGPSKAITATARKLAVIYYHMVRYGLEYIELGADYYIKNYKEIAIKKLKRNAKQLGFELVSVS